MCILFPQKNSELLNFSNHSFYPVCCSYIYIYIYIYPIIPFIQFPSPPPSLPFYWTCIYIYIQNTHTFCYNIYNISSSSPKWNKRHNSGRPHDQPRCNSTNTRSNIFIHLINLHNLRITLCKTIDY